MRIEENKKVSKRASCQCFDSAVRPKRQPRSETSAKDERKKRAYKGQPGMVNQREEGAQNVAAGTKEAKAIGDNKEKKRCKFCS